MPQWLMSVVVRAADIVDAAFGGAAVMVGATVVHGTAVMAGVGWGRSRDWCRSCS